MTRSWKNLRQLLIQVSLYSLNWETQRFYEASNKKNSPNKCHCMILGHILFSFPVSVGGRSRYDQHIK